MRRLKIVDNIDYENRPQYNLMASVHTEEQKNRANRIGCRTFRVLSAGDKPLPDEIICPATKEGGAKTTCIKCMLCNGNKSTDIFVDKRKNIAAYAHG